MGNHTITWLTRTESGTVPIVQYDNMLSKRPMIGEKDGLFPPESQTRFSKRLTGVKDVWECRTSSIVEYVMPCLQGITYFFSISIVCPFSKFPTTLIYPLFRYCVATHRLPSCVI